MLGHHDVANQLETMSISDVSENVNKGASRVGHAEQGEAAVAAKREKV